MSGASSNGAPSPARASEAASLRLRSVTPLPDTLAVGRGTALFVDGTCEHASRRIRRLVVSTGADEQQAMAWEMPMPGSAAASGPYWWAIVPFGEIDSPRTVTLHVRAELAGGGSETRQIGTIGLTPALPDPREGNGPEPPEGAEGPLVAVAMASFEPPIDLFRGQIESIRAQTHANWICVISDDCSSAESIEAMREVIGEDRRFLLAEGTRRLGVYRNFERALTLVPDAADHVALSDQDDRWRPEKLERLVAAMRPGVTLAYSDMRIVERDGTVSSETYWSMRRNNYTNFASLVLANTVTGAASLIDRELLDDVLPFPPRHGNAYHDHWIAQTALAVGEIAYVDEPLYDYVQHGGASLGHLSANAFGRYRRPLPAKARAAVARLRNRGFSRGWKLYFDLFCRVRLAAMVLDMRAGKRLGPRKRATLRRIADTTPGVAWLALRSTRSAFGANETLGRERAILMGLTWRRIVSGRKRAGRAFDRGGRAAPAIGSGATASGAAAAGSGSGSGSSSGSEWLQPLLVDYFTRDGSTLMMRLLSSSPQVATEGVYPYEQKYFAYLWRWAQTLERLRWPEEQWGPRSLGSLGQFRDEALVGPPPWHPRELIDAAPGEQTMAERSFELVWSEFSRRAARVTRQRHGSDAPVRYAAEKHLNSWLVDFEQGPDVQLVVLLRDPRDTWVSINSFNRMRGTATLGRDRADSDDDHLRQIVARQGERLRWISGLLDAGEVPVVRYEDMVLDLPGVAASLGERLGVEFDAAEVARDSDMRARHVSADTPEKSIGRWREELDERTAELFTSELDSELRAVGFEV